MKIKSVTKLALDQAVPVYDATSPKHHNYVLANGCVVHNTAKMARNKDYQEVFYLRGKILNSMRSKDAQVFASDEVIGILKAIGFDPSNADPMAHLRVGRIIWLSDPDDDGYHINTLGLTLLYKYLPRLFDLGKVFIVAASEYTATIKGKRVYENNKSKLTEANGGKTPSDLLHIKGWGEVTPSVLREMAFSKLTRRLYKVTPPKDGGKTFRLIMSDDPSFRKKMLGV